MSYILDALRKSEQERQIASGHGAGMLYPVMAEHNPKRVLKPFLLAGAALGVAGIAIGLIRWSPLEPAATANAGKAEKPVAATPRAMLPARELVSPMPAALPATPAPRRKPASVEPGAPVAEKDLAESAPATKKSSAQGLREARQETPPGASGDRAEAAAESPKGLPKLVISGYINDEQGGRLAIVNDKLVHEGEEVAPGLRLEKVIDDSAVFSYKGQRFRR